MGADFLMSIPRKFILSMSRRVRPVGQITSSYGLEGLGSNHQISSDGDINAQASTIIWREVVMTEGSKWLEWSTTRSADFSTNGLKPIARMNLILSGDSGDSSDLQLKC